MSAGWARGLWLSFLCGFGLGACARDPAAVPEPPPSAPTPGAAPNFLVLLPDSFRADRLQRRRDGEPLTPHLDALAHRGVIFERAVSQAGWTIPALATALTGRYPLLPEPNAARMGWMEPDQRAFSDILALYDYHTVGFVGARSDALLGVFAPHFQELIQASGQAPWAQGASAELAGWLRAGPQEPFLAFVHDVDLRFVASVDDLERWPGSAERCGGVFDSKRDKPLDIVALRPCLDPDDAIAAAQAADAYDRTVALYDQGLGQVLDALEQAGLAERTVILVSSPHGHHLGEGGRFHHSTLYEPDLRIPLVWFEPGQAGSGLRVERPVELLDLAPSLLARAAVPREQGMQGQSLLPLLGLAEGDYRERDIFSVNDRLSFAVRAGGLELQRLRPHGTEGGDQEARVQHLLFDLEADPQEATNLWTGSPSEPALALCERLESFERTMLDRPPLRRTPGGEPDDVLRRHLVDQGYWHHVDPQHGGAPPAEPLRRTPAEAPGAAPSGSSPR